MDANPQQNGVKMQKVLLIEDTEEIYQLINRFKSPEADIQWVTSLQAGLKALRSDKYDLILLDLGLPDGDGLQILSWLASLQTDQVPEVMVLTSKDSVADKVLGFSLGADDYVSKPFDPIELKARIDARLRKMRTKTGSQDVLRWDGIEIHRLQQKVLIGSRQHMEQVYLTSTEFRLLITMATHPLKVFSRDELLDLVWGESLHVYPRSVDTHVSKLRKKLGEMSHLVESVHGSGYRFNPPQMAKQNTVLRGGIVTTPMEQPQLL
jgi:two-component system phosphate regulon response regulator PhoB